MLGKSTCVGDALLMDIGLDGVPRGTLKGATSIVIVRLLALVAMQVGSLFLGWFRLIGR